MPRRYGVRRTATKRVKLTASKRRALATLAGSARKRTRSASSGRRRSRGSRRAYRSGGSRIRRIVRRELMRMSEPRVVDNFGRILMTPRNSLAWHFQRIPFPARNINPSAAAEGTFGGDHYVRKRVDIRGNVRLWFPAPQTYGDEHVVRPIHLRIRLYKMRPGYRQNCAYDLVGAQSFLPDSWNGAFVGTHPGQASARRLVAGDTPDGTLSAPNSVNMFTSPAKTWHQFSRPSWIKGFNYGGIRTSSVNNDEWGVEGEANARQNGREKRFMKLLASRSYTYHPAQWKSDPQIIGTLGTWVNNNQRTVGVKEVPFHMSYAPRGGEQVKIQELDTATNEYGTTNSDLFIAVCWEGNEILPVETVFGSMDVQVTEYFRDPQ